MVNSQVEPPIGMTALCQSSSPTDSKCLHAPASLASRKLVRRTRRTAHVAQRTRHGNVAEFKQWRRCQLIELILFLLLFYKSRFLVYN